MVLLIGASIGWRSLILNLSPFYQIRVFFEGDRRTKTRRYTANEL